jgi:hypothetical protein
MRIVPAVVIGAYAGHRAFQARAQYVRAIASLAIVWMTVLVFDLGDAGQNFERAGLTGDAWCNRGRCSGALPSAPRGCATRFGSDPPSRTIEPLRPFFSYVDRCTTETSVCFSAG